MYFSYITIIIFFLISSNLPHFLPHRCRRVHFASKSQRRQPIHESIVFGKTLIVGSGPWNTWVWSMGMFYRRRRFWRFLRFSNRLGIEAVIQIPHGVSLRGSQLLNESWIHSGFAFMKGEDEGELNVIFGQKLTAKIIFIYFQNMKN